MSRMTPIWAAAALAASLIASPSFAGETTSTGKDPPAAEAKSHDCCPDAAASNSAYWAPTGMERKGGPRSAQMKPGPRWVGSPFESPDDIAAREKSQAESKGKIKPYFGPPSKGTGR